MIDLKSIYSDHIKMQLAKADLDLSAAFRTAESYFVRLPTKAQHYKCAKCGAYFSDMTGFPIEAKTMIFKTHIRDCEG